MVTTTTRNFELLLENKQPAIAGCILQQPEQSQEISKRTSSFARLRRASNLSSLSSVGDFETEALHLPSVTDEMLVTLDSALKDILEDEPTQWLSSVNSKSLGHASYTSSSHLSEAQTSVQTSSQSAPDNLPAGVRMENTDRESISNLRPHAKSRSVSESRSVTEFRSESKPVSSAIPVQSTASARRAKIRTESKESILHQEAVMSGALEDINARDYTVTKADTNEPEIDKLQKQLRLARLYHRSGEFRQARQEYERFDQVMSQVESRTLELTTSAPWRSLRIEHGRGLAILSLNQGKYKQAEQDFVHFENECSESLPELDPTRLEISQWMGISLCRMGKYKKANAKLREVLEKLDTAISQPASKPKVLSSLKNCQILTQNALALVISYLGNFEDAIGHASEALLSLQTTQKETSMKIDDAGRSSFQEREGLVHANRASIQLMSGNYDSARSAVDLASKIMEHHLGTKHVATLECSALSAHISLAQGNIRDSETQCRKTLRAMQSELGDSHPLTLGTVGLLVTALISLARLTEARQTAKHLVRMNEEILGQEHPHSVHSRSQLAMVCTTRGELVDGLHLLEGVVKDADSIFGSSHPQTLNYRTSLASAYCSLGKWERGNRIALDIIWMQYRGLEADHKQGNLVSENREELLHATLRYDSLNKCHISFFSTLHIFGVSEYYRVGGDPQLAFRVLETTLSHRNDKLSSNHPDTLSTRLQRGILLRESSKLECAEAEILTVVKARKSIFGSDHPESLVAMHELEFTKFHLDFVQQNTKAAEDHISEQEEILNIQNAILDWYHPDSIQSSLHLSTAYAIVGNYVEASKFLFKSIAAEIYVLDPQRFEPDVAGISVDENDTDQASSLTATILTLLSSERLSKASNENADGKETPGLTAGVKTDIETLIYMYGRTGNYTAALGFQKVLVEQDRIEYGSDGLETLSAKHELAVIYQELGMFEDAKELYNQVMREVPSPPTQSQRSLLSTCQLSLALLYFKNDMFEEARELQQQALKDLQEAEDPEDRVTLIRTQFNLALTMKALELKAEGLPYLKAAAAAAEKEMELGNPERSRIFKTLSRWHSETHLETDSSCSTPRSAQSPDSLSDKVANGGQPAQLWDSEPAA